MIDLHERLREEVAAYALGTLDVAAHARLEAHLDGCESCRTLLADYTALLQSLADMRRTPAPPGGRERLLERIRAQSAMQPMPALGRQMPAALMAPWVVDDFPEPVAAAAAAPRPPAADDAPLPSAEPAAPPQGRVRRALARLGSISRRSRRGGGR